MTMRVIKQLCRRTKGVIGSATAASDRRAATQQHIPVDTTARTQRVPSLGLVNNPTGSQLSVAHRGT
jgi:hypothetical protein